MKVLGVHSAKEKETEHDKELQLIMPSSPSVEKALKKQGVSGMR